MITEELPKYQVIASSLGDRIRRGELRGKLAGERQLASDFGVHVLTANKAVKVLVDEGVCYRIKGRGTFITDSSIKTRFPIGLVHEVKPELMIGHPFFATIVSFLNDEANKKCYNFQLYNASLDDKAVKSLGNNSNQSLAETFNSKNLSAILLFIASTAPLLKELREAKLPFVSFKSTDIEENVPNQVGIDVEGMLEKAIFHLRHSNVGKIGIIEPYGYRLFEKVLKKMNVSSSEVQYFGDDLDMALKKVDGLFVSDDYYMLEQHERFIESLPVENVVVATNKGVKLPASWPVLETDPIKIAKMGWKLLCGQLSDGFEKREPSLVTPTLHVP